MCQKCSATFMMMGIDCGYYNVSAKLIPHGVGGCEQVETWNRPANVGASFYVCYYA